MRSQQILSWLQSGSASLSEARCAGHASQISSFAYCLHFVAWAAWAWTASWEDSCRWSGLPGACVQSWTSELTLSPVAAALRGSAARPLPCPAAPRVPWPAPWLPACCPASENRIQYSRHWRIGNLHLGCCSTGVGAARRPFVVLVVLAVLAACDAAGCLDRLHPRRS